MRVGLERGLADACEQFTKRRTTGKIRAHDEHVHEKSDHPLGLAARPPGDRRADADVPAPGVAVELRLKRGEQQHVKRHALALGEGLQGLHELDGKENRFAFLGGIF